MAGTTYRDAWGIPHLRASDPLRLAFAQGRNAARDRAWQLEVERHRSQGTTASFLGAGAVPWNCSPPTVPAPRARTAGWSRATAPPPGRR